MKSNIANKRNIELSRQIALWKIVYYQRIKETTIAPFGLRDVVGHKRIRLVLVLLSSKQSKHL
jgi:hypothetical protein